MAWMRLIEGNVPRMLLDPKNYLRSTAVVGGAKVAMRARSFFASLYFCQWNIAHADLGSHRTLDWDCFNLGRVRRIAAPAQRVATRIGATAIAGVVGSMVNYVG
jgi:hypothetical protein